jgi:hypothetical protein
MELRQVKRYRSRVRLSVITLSSAMASGSR